jgi:hypothetical protein
MFLFRRGAVGFAASVLLVQLCVFAVMAVAPAFCCARPAAATGTPDCCKAAGHSCPLLKKSAPPAHGALRTCARDDERIVSLLFGTTAVLVSVAPLVPPAFTSALGHDPAYKTVRVAPADGPPPRA